MVWGRMKVLSSDSDSLGGRMFMVAPASARAGTTDILTVDAEG